MSTQRTPSEPAARRRTRRAKPTHAFGAAFAIVVAVLAALGLGGAGLTTAQGPRITDVQLDADASIAASGSRIILTMTQAVADVAPEQITVTPAAAFTVETAGRNVGIRFVLPLWDDTDYTIRIDDLAGVGGGPAASVEESFRTPTLHAFILVRGDEDTVFRTDLTGESAVPVFTDPHIEDFRTTGSHLIVSTVDDQDLSHLIVTDLDGQDPRELALPGRGRAADLQVAERGARVGYTFTDADIGAAGGRESMLFTASVNDPEAAPVGVERATESRVVQWRFVPGTDRVLMLTFDGELTLAGPDGSDPVALGTALHIYGIAAGSTLALVDTADGVVGLDLATSHAEPIARTDPALGQTGEVTPLPGGGTLRVLSQVDGFTVTATRALSVDEAGAVREVFAVGAGDVLMQTCVSPSGRYAAFLVAPDAVDNPYDGYQLPLPERLQTHLVALENGTELVALTGFDVSWCGTAPAP